jgi:hypothetical protein
MLHALNHAVCRWAASWQSKLDINLNRTMLSVAFLPLDLRELRQLRWITQSGQMERREENTQRAYEGRQQLTMLLDTDEGIRVHRSPCGPKVSL